MTCVLARRVLQHVWLCSHVQTATGLLVASCPAGEKCMDRHRDILQVIAAHRVMVRIEDGDDGPGRRRHKLERVVDILRLGVRARVSR